MTAVNLSAPPFLRAFVDETGHVSAPWRPWLQSVYLLLFGDGYDKVDAALSTAQSAAPGANTVVGVGGLQIGGPLSGNPAVALYASEGLVANLPTTAREGDWAYAQDGRKPGEGAGAGTGVPCFFSRGTWIAVTSGAAVTA